MSRLIPTLALVLVIPGCGRARDPAAPVGAKTPATSRLLELMRSRLEVMHDVARWKWSARSPIEDPAREAALLGDVADRGVALGLDPATTRAFFAAQIEAAKLVQRADFARWEAYHLDPGGEPPDLAGVLRPRIDALNRELLVALADARHFPEMAAQIRARADEILIGDGIDAAVRAAAIRPLLEPAGSPAPPSSGGP